MRNFFTKQKAQGEKSKGKRGFPNSSSGYTLLFAMIVASIVLVLGVSILNISQKEFELSSSATQSSNAFYAADSGLSCAEYWNNASAFATSSPVATTTCSDSLGAIPVIVYECTSGSGSCSDPSISTDPPENLSDVSGGNTYEFTFYTPFQTDGTPTNLSCAAVSVEKYYAKDTNLGGDEVIHTRITSAGYNLGWEGNESGGVYHGNCSVVSPKKVNRTIQTTFD